MVGEVTVVSFVALALSDGVEVTRETSDSALVVALGSALVLDSCGVIDTVCA